MQDEKWKSLFAIIGVTEQQMKEKSTREFIYNFVEQKGGIEAVTKQIEQETMPKLGTYFIMKNFLYILLLSLCNSDANSPCTTCIYTYIVHFFIF